MHLHAFFLFSLLSLGVLAERATKRNAQPTPEPHPRALSTEELVDSPGFERRDVVYPTRCRAVGNPCDQDNVCASNRCSNGRCIGCRSVGGAGIPYGAACPGVLRDDCCSSQCRLTADRTTFTCQQCI
ncbi:hypothetical protein AC578_715 [Pseudocercospora eumusae]|uniref:Uncharacterized protein n=1 Tax=Pseudocercospora eumusae TaxID=321146 RepID=A0A139HMT1_9PEZI|nr:hypothetical protein AC578_715 [Pseudocercospora eumusae]